MSHILRFMAALLPVTLIAQFPLSQPETSPLPLASEVFSPPTTVGGDLYGFGIACSKPGCQLDVFLKTLKPFQTYTPTPTLVGIDGGFFRGLDRAFESQLRPYEEQLRRRLINPASQPLVLTVVLNGAKNTIYEITIERWDGGVLLSSLVAVPNMAPSAGCRSCTSVLVKVSPQSFADAARQSARSGELNAANRLLQTTALLYPQPEVVSRIQKAIDDGTSDAIADRLSHAAQSRSVGDWQLYTSLLSETRTRYPQSREKVKEMLSTDIESGRDSLRTGGGLQALEIARRVRTVLPDFAPAQALESEARSQVVADTLKKAQASEAKGAFDDAQSVVVAALKMLPDDQQLQSRLASIQDQLDTADRKKMTDAKEAAERAATGRRAVGLAEALSSCRAALDSKDYTSALDRCGSLIGIYPQESAANTLVARLRIEVPLRAYRSHAEAEQILAIPETVPSSMAIGKVGNTVNWHGLVRLKTVDNYYVIDTSSGSFVIHQKAGEPFLRIGEAVAVIGKIESWPTIGTLGGRPQIMPMLQPGRID